MSIKWIDMTKLMNLIRRHQTSAALKKMEEQIYCVKSSFSGQMK